MMYKPLTMLSNSEIKAALNCIFKPQMIEFIKKNKEENTCLLYTSDAADE